MDNLFGLQTLDECVEIYNHVLAKYDLPPFTKNTRLQHRQTSEFKSSSLIGNGAEITSIDWTKNHEVGEGKERSFISGMSSMQIGRGRTPKLYPNGMTCNWGEGSTWNMSKLYCKKHELNEHLKKDQKRNNGITEAQSKYVKKLINYCEKRGVVREEHSLRQGLLKRHNLQFYGLVSEQDFHKHILDIENAMNTLQVNHDEHQSIAHQLLASGAVNTLRKANVTMSYFSVWQHGEDLRNILSQSQFYEHKARLKHIGIDIGQPFDVSRMCPTLKRSELIEVKPLPVPNWYQLPVVAESNVLPFRAIA
jgi:II/X family phage/plasmid replication protein